MSRSESFVYRSFHKIAICITGSRLSPAFKTVHLCIQLRRQAQYHRNNSAHPTYHQTRLPLRQIILKYCNSSARVMLTKPWAVMKCQPPVIEGDHMNSRDSYPRLLIMRCFFPLPLGWSQRKKMESLDFYYCPAKKATTPTYQCHGRPHGNQKQGINIPVNQWDISRDLVGTLESHMHSAIMSRLPFPGL